MTFCLVTKEPIFIAPDYKVYSNHTLLAAKGSINVVGWLVVLGLTVLRDNISVYIGPSPRERREKKCPNNLHLHLLQAQ